MRINTNIASLTAQEASVNTNKSLSSSLEKLGSGLRINKASDDASGLAIADKLRTQASSLGQGISNANSASALIQIADKAMAEQSNILDTVKTKLIQASTSTTNDDGREAIRKDINKLLTQFDNIAAQTNYNGTTLLQKSATDTAVQDQLDFQLGEDSSFDVSIQATKASNSDGLGGGADTITSAALNTIPTGGTAKTDNNIAVAGAQQINTAGSVSLTTIDVANTGTEAAGAAGLDITISGSIGKIQSGGSATMDLSSETQATLDAVKILAASDANLTFTSSTGSLAFTAAGSADFGDLEFSAATYVGGDATGLNLNLGTTETTFTVSNNYTDTTTPLLNQINMSGSAAMTGGKLLSDLKELSAGELTADLSNSFMATIDEALTQMNANRSDFGSTQNQLQSSVRNMQTTQTNLKAAESVIRDVDYASESASFNKQNIIAQAGTYAMSQANSMAQNVQKLLQ